MDDQTQLRALLTRAADDVGVLHPPSVDLITRRYQRRRLVVSVLAPACAALMVLWYWRSRWSSWCAVRIMRPPCTRPMSTS
jgi:hypothetical protein